MPRSIIQTSRDFATLHVFRFHSVEEGEAFRRGVFKGGHFVGLVDGERPAAQKAPLLMRETQ
jgi:hypothetical protein